MSLSRHWACTAMAVALCLWVWGCGAKDKGSADSGIDSGPEADSGSDIDGDGDSDSGSDTDIDGDGDTDADTDIDAGGDAGGDGGADLFGAFHCNYETPLFDANCYEYAREVSRADAEADCSQHELTGGLEGHSHVFGDGPCTLTTTGYCYTATQTPRGREFLVTSFGDATDCLPSKGFSAAWACETMSTGKYICTL